MSMAIMQYVATVTWVFPREFQQWARDAGMAKENINVCLVLVLNQDILGCLNVYINMRGGDEMAHLENVQNRLCRVLCF